jgi:phosphatidylserine/phosphatidylglycerophosphate/cardiolipin synthase-like enzyme
MLMTTLRTLAVLAVVTATIAGATPARAAGTPEDTVRQYLKAMQDQKYDEAYKQISKAMAGGKDAEAWAKEQKYMMQSADVKIFKFDVYPAKVDGNTPARTRLTKTAAVVYNRLLPNNQIGHNKFVVYVDKTGHPRAVLFGSTNWTPTGLCAQTNNTIVLDNAKVAQRYLDYWKQLKADTQQAKTDPKALQGATLRTWDGGSKDISLGADGTLTSWFSPNTPKLRSSSTKNEKRPPDMADVVKAIEGAKRAVLFLVFYPGSPNVAQWAADAQRANKDLFVRGCVTNPSASESFYYELHGITPPKDGKGKQDSRVIAADALDEKSAPAGWMKEILNAGFAIIHDKVVVIDPFSDDCVVITGSHNLGHKASFNNDENLVIIRGNRKLAAAYASHVLDVYDHFAWRVAQQDPRQKGDGFLKVKPDDWQGKYFNADGSIRVAQLRFWLSALV